MRGTLGTVLMSGRCAGIIPAHAGNTRASASTTRAPRDHPRACGEHSPLLCLLLCGTGSSPRMRGTLTSGCGVSIRIGIIPAHAGNTRRCVRLLDVCRDHPRACGEHWLVVRRVERQVGSSPRMRGTLAANSVTTEKLGIIPAHAGNTICVPLRWIAPRDHPRACGEHLLFLLASASSQGSSPRMRGTHVGRIRNKQMRGIIPAHAGNTAILKSCRLGIRDHPRACGEHEMLVIISDGAMGSSPRMRGTLFHLNHSPLLLGIIPAHAGNTHGSTDHPERPWDHPRACGEHQGTEETLLKYVGSSPRMRGTPFTVEVDGLVMGIIPAHAGNTPPPFRLFFRCGDHPRACGEHRR